MTLKLRNTMSGELEEFSPAGETVTMYVCGVTPYDVSHVGHAMSYVIFDTLRRYLEYRDRKSTRLNSSHIQKSRMPSSA